MKNLRVLVLNIEFPPIGGGASPVSYQIASRLQSRGHDITVLTMHFHGLAEQEMYHGMKIIRIKSNRKKMDMSYIPEHLIFLFNAWRYLRKNCHNSLYDVCHTHFILPCGILAYWIRATFRIPYIITSHGSDIPHYNQDRFRFIHHFTPALIKRITRHCSQLVCPSKHLLTLIRNQHLAGNHKLAHIPNGINPEQFLPKSKEPIILSTGRLVRRKGFHILIEAVSDIQSNFTLHICGDGPMLSELKRMAKTSLTPVVFHGWLDNTSEKYKQLLGSASIYCLVSENENASIALLEAMSAGCAVITSDIGGCIETVADSGVCIECNNPLLLGQKIRELISDPVLIETYGKKAMNRINELYGWNTIVNKYEDLLYRCSVQ